MDHIALVVRRFRGAKQVWTQDVVLIPDLRHSVLKKLYRLAGLRYYRFDLCLNIEWTAVHPGIFGIEVYTKASRKTFHFRSDPVATGLFGGDFAHTFYVFSEPSVQVVRLELHALNTHAVERLKLRSQSTSCSTPVCVVGEYPDTARDNGFFLFRALRKIPHAIEAFYVVDAHNSDNIQAGVDNVLPWGSEEHISACIDASVCAFTHHRNYVYPAIVSHIAPDQYEQTRTLFLQHGVMAMKGGPVLRHYHRQRVNYHAVVVSSQREKKIFTDHFGYPAPAVHITGLSRLDHLYDRASQEIQVENQILVAPTWRPGLDKMSQDQATTDPYTLNWSKAMQEMQDRGFRPILIGHQIMKDNFAVLGRNATEVRNNKRFQETLLQSRALVTDYSSVAWDALYIDRPVFLFQFDRDRVGFSKHAFIADKDMPGPVDIDPVSLVERLTSAAAAGWVGGSKAKRDGAFLHIDARNTARTIQLIEDLSCPPEA